MRSHHSSRVLLHQTIHTQLDLKPYAPRRLPRARHTPSIRPNKRPSPQEYPWQRLGIAVRKATPADRGVGEQNNLAVALGDPHS